MTIIFDNISTSSELIGKIHYTVCKIDSRLNLQKKEWKSLNLIQDGFFQGYSQIGGQKDPPLQNLSHVSYNDETWHRYILTKGNRKMYKSRDTLFDFC